MPLEVRTTPSVVGSAFRASKKQAQGATGPAQRSSVSVEKLARSLRAASARTTSSSSRQPKVGLSRAAPHEFSNGHGDPYMPHVRPVANMVSVRHANGRRAPTDTFSIVVESASQPAASLSSLPSRAEAVSDIESVFSPRDLETPDHIRAALGSTSARRQPYSVDEHGLVYPAQLASAYAFPFPFSSQSRLLQLAEVEAAFKTHSCRPLWCRVQDAKGAETYCAAIGRSEAVVDQGSGSNGSFSVVGGKGRACVYKAVLSLAGSVLYRPVFFDQTTLVGDAVVLDAPPSQSDVQRAVDCRVVAPSPAPDHDVDKFGMVYPAGCMFDTLDSIRTRLPEPGDDGYSAADIEAYLHKRLSRPAWIKVAFRTKNNEKRWFVGTAFARGPWAKGHYTEPRARLVRVFDAVRVGDRVCYRMRTFNPAKMVTEVERLDGRPRLGDLE